jgi:aqualysin 1
MIMRLKEMLVGFGIMATIAACNQVTPDFDTSLNEVPVYGAEARNAIPGQYIVVLKKTPENAVLVQRLKNGVSPQMAVGVAGLQLKNVYTSALYGFAGRMQTNTLETLRNDERVAYIEVDSVVQTNATQSNATWGLDRIDQRALPLTTTYNYNTTASNVHAYVVDTGIRLTHNEFTGRIGNGYDAISSGGNANDCNGHGTHVAGTVGGTTYGVAKGVTLHAVRVLDCNGSGSNSGVIAGVDWVRDNHVKPAVANMSLGGGASTALDNAVSSAISAGVTFVVAAGNSNANACNYSPARTASAITVGSTTSSDVRSSFSNFGTCLDVFAPGSSITSAWYTGDSNINTISGTSMASPHVAGIAALYLANNANATPNQVRDALVNTSTAGSVSSAGTGSPNLLVYSELTGSNPPPPPPSGDTYTGTFTSSRTNQYQPSTTGFSYTGGTLKGTLGGPSNADFDLFLQKLNGSSWSTVARSEGATSSENITYSAGSGTYRWRVYSYSGTGSYSLTTQK